MAETPAVEAAARAQDQRAASRENVGAGSRQAVTYKPSAGSRTIFGLMAVAVTFSLVGNEIKSFQSAPTVTKNPVSTATKIILGGFVGSAVLIVVSKAGEPGRKFAVGTATVVLVASTLVYGGPVWRAASNLFGSKPTTPTGGTTGGTSPTGGTSSSGATTTTLPTIAAPSTTGSNPT